METTLIGLMSIFITILGNIFIEVWRKRKTPNEELKDKAVSDKTTAETLEQLRTSLSNLVTDYDNLLTRFNKTRDELLEKIENLQKEYHILVYEKEELLNGINKLVKQMKLAGIVPVWTPDDIERNKVDE